MGKFRDLTGLRFGRLTVIKQYSNNHGQIKWLCRCDCGGTTTVLGGHLITGHTKSCGCLERETKATQQGLRVKYPKLYRVWSHMKSRCENPKDKSYKGYGARGIAVCKEWQTLRNFIEWALNNGYKENLTLDRINNDGNYEPCNCRFTDVKTQSNNRRSNRYETYNGETHTVAEWADILKVPYHKITYRLNKCNWSISQVINHLTK